MNPLVLVGLAAAIDAERLRQARLARRGRRMRAAGTTRAGTRPVQRPID